MRYATSLGSTPFTRAAAIVRSAKSSMRSASTVASAGGGRSETNVPRAGRILITPVRASAPQCVEVNSQSNGHLPHRGHFLTRANDAGTDCPKDLVPNLHIDRHACSFDALVTFFVILYLTRRGGWKVALASAVIGTAAAPMIFEFPFDLLVMARTNPPIPIHPVLYRQLFFLPLFLVELSTIALLTLLASERVTAYASYAGQECLWCSPSGLRSGSPFPRNRCRSR